MLALVLALSVSQAPVVDSRPPLPMPESFPGVSKRSARLVPQREDTGVLVARMATTTAGVLVGGSLAGLAGVGVVGLGAALCLNCGGFGAVFGLMTLAALSPVVMGIGVVGVAAGAAFFGSGSYAENFRAALSVAGLSVPLGVAVAAVMLMFGVPAILAIALPVLAVGIVTPVVVELRKPMPSRRTYSVEPVVPEGGLTIPL